MPREGSGTDEAGDIGSKKSDGAAGNQPPRHVPERRGSGRSLGGRRANDRRSQGDDSKDGGGQGDDEDDEGEGGEHEDGDGGKDKDGKDGDQEDKDKDDKDKGKPSPLKKTWVRVLIVVVVLLLLIAAIAWLVYYLSHGRYVQNTNDAYVRADKVAVTAAVAARVKRIAIVDNQVVKAGDLLVELDTRTANARVRQFAAQAAQSNAEADQYRSQIAAQEATVAQYAAQARGAKVQRDYHAGEVQRYAPLVATGAERDEQLAQLRQNRDKAAEDMLQYRAAELAARRQIATLKTQVVQALAKVQQAAAQEAQSAVDVDDAIVRAAVAGRVGDRQIHPGTYVNTGTQMMTIIPIDALYVEANFKETQLGLMRVGQPVTIRVDALGGTTVHGTVASFSPATGAEFSVLPPQNATGNFTKVVQRVPVRIELDAGPEARRVLVAGLSVVVDVDTVGNKDDADRRKQEEKDREDRVKQQRRSQIERDRTQREPGPGR